MKVNIGKYPKTSRPRKIDVRIEDFDTWNADNTLAIIIAPLLMVFKAKENGCPFVDDDDVPAELRRDEENENATSEELDKYRSVRWHYVLDEMIWTFNTIAGNIEEPDFFGGDPDAYQFDKEMYDEHENRISNGCRLFGKYFRALWN